LPLLLPPGFNGVTPTLGCNTGRSLIFGAFGACPVYAEFNGVI